MDSLPAAVRKTATEQGKGATMRGGISRETEHGKTLYEVELTVNGHTRDVLIAADGSVSEVEEEIAVASLPAPVKVTYPRAGSRSGQDCQGRSGDQGRQAGLLRSPSAKGREEDESERRRPDGKLMPKEKD